MKPQVLRKNIKSMTLLFIVLLLLSGITAFPIQTELYWIDSMISDQSMLGAWVAQVHEAVIITNEQYPMLSYGTDWLAFAHIVIAIAFIGPLKDPVRNIWIYQFGMIACVLVIPLALMMGTIREVPFFWQLIDCSFGVLGFMPLYLCYKWTRTLELAVLH